MKPVRLPASATLALPRWALFALCLLYILPGLIGRDPWKNIDAGSFGIMWTMAHGGVQDWLWPHIVGLQIPEEGPLAFWLGALCIKLFGGLLGDVMAARVATIGFFLLGSLSVWYATYLFGRRNDAQPLTLAFGGQPEPKDFGRTLADGALLIYLGCLGLLLHSHSTSAEALQVALVAFSLYATARLFESQSMRAAALLGVALGLLALTRGWLIPAALAIGLIAVAAVRARAIAGRLAALTVPIAALVVGAWVLASQVVQPFNSSPVNPWMAWNLHQFSLPSWNALWYFLKNSIWFAWPAWPFAFWSVYAWRRQNKALHILLPLTFFVAVTVLALLNPDAEQAILLPLLPPLAILAAFGLPTMKRGAINAIDWFSVMTLTTCAAFIWIGWVAKQTGWPAQIAKNAFKLAPGFRPEFNWLAVVVAALVSISWIMLVHWRVSRRPSVLWRAVVLSSGGVILCWLLLMTLWLPWGNYMRSYEGVAQQIAQKLPTGPQCVETDVGPDQRASFAYYGHIPFASFNNATRCNYLLLQDNNRKKGDARLITRSSAQWSLLWEGRRPSDRDERYRLYQRLN